MKLREEWQYKKEQDSYQKVQGGKGILLQGVPGVQPGHVVIIGAGVAGTAAATAAVGLGARVTMIDVNLDALTELSHIFGGKIETLYSNKFNIANAIKTADLVVSTVLIPGAKAPKLVTKEMVKRYARRWCNCGRSD